MNIQIFGNLKCFDTKKAQRYFKERGIKFQFIDIYKYPMSLGEFNSVKNSLGGIDFLIKEKSNDEDFILLSYLSLEDKEKKIFENQRLIKTPVVRNGRKAVVGYCPDIWKNWD